MASHGLERGFGKRSFITRLVEISESRPFWRVAAARKSCDRWPRLHQHDARACLSCRDKVPETPHRICCTDGVAMKRKLQIREPTAVPLLNGYEPLQVR